MAAERHPYRTAPVRSPALRWGVQFPVSAWSTLGGIAVGFSINVAFVPTRNGCLAHLAILAVWALAYVRKVP